MRSVILSIFSITLFAIPAFAQGIPTSINQITLTASSNNPTPGQIVTITAVSYSFDINSATITWAVNGKQAKKGIGVTTLDVPAPALGKKTTVTVTAVTTDGSSYNNSISLGSGLIDMIIETDGYTPPFFKGKTPLVFQNTVTVIAVPHLISPSGKEYDPSTLVYQWSEDNGTVLQDQSGYGKQSISLKGSLVPRPFYLIVIASSRDGSAQAESLIHIQPTSPLITFYNDDSLYGPLFNKAITGSFHIGSEKETSAFASLFGFNFSNTIANDLTLDWMINSTEHSELASNQVVALRAPDGVAGTSHIELSVQGVNNILQKADNSFNVSFDTTGSPSAVSNPINL